MVLVRFLDPEMLQLSGDCISNRGSREWYAGEFCISLAGELSETVQTRGNPRSSASISAYVREDPSSKRSTTRDREFVIGTSEASDYGEALRQIRARAPDVD